jgi:transcriptional regulator with XRE-family HTH domain
MGAFHNDLEQLLKERRLTEEQVSLQAGLYSGAVSRYHRERTYPLPDAFDPLARVLGASADVAEAWKAEASAARRRHDKAFTVRAQQRHLAEVPQRDCLGGCGNPLTTTDQDRRFCRFCSYTNRVKWLTDTDLKARFIARLRTRKIFLKQASVEIKANYGTLTDWLKRPLGRLNEANLLRAAAWLEISIDKAIRLQGGTAKEHQREAALTTLESEGVRKHMERMGKKGQRSSRQTRYVQRVIDRMNEKVRGTHQSAEHSERIRQRQKAYRQTPAAHDLGQYHSTPLGRAYQFLRGLRRYRADWTPQELTAEAVRRLLQPPYGIESDKAARMLIAGYALSRWLRHERRPSWERIKELADQTGREVGLSKNEVLQCWRPRLEKARLWRNVGGRPKEVERCRRIREDLDREGVSIIDERSPYRFWIRSAQRAPTKDSQQPTNRLQTMFWRDHRCPECQSDLRLRNS